jgi:glycosyltransferase involved in cell wall biosynthesis
MLSWCEFYYQPKGQDAGFDPEFPDEDPLANWRLRMKNAVNLLALDTTDWGITATAFQKSTHPALYQPKISVIHEGINTAIVKPEPGVRLTLSNGAVLNAGDELLTFVNRNLEPIRGFHVFMRALPRILRERPNARVAILGGDETSYGRPPADGVTFRKRMLQELDGQLDVSRVFFLGKLPYKQYLALLQASRVHVYLTYPFVLGWSMIEAMSAGCLVVGSRTAPVTEVLRHGENGLLVDFFDIDGLASTVCEALARPEQYLHLRQAARRTAVERYDLQTVCMPRQLALMQAVARGQPPGEFSGPPVAMPAG